MRARNCRRRRRCEPSPRLRIVRRAAARRSASAALQANKPCITTVRESNRGKVRPVRECTLGRLENAPSSIWTAVRVPYSMRKCPREFPEPSRVSAPRSPVSGKKCVTEEILKIDREIRAIDHAIKLIAPSGRYRRIERLFGCLRL